MNLDKIAALCAPWNHAFSHSKLISGVVIGVHIMALVIGGGLAIATDRWTIRVALGDAAAKRQQLREVRDVHAIVLAGVVVLLVTGVLLAAADVETFLPSPIFWLKLLLVALLIVNGAVLNREERQLSEMLERGTGSASADRWGRVRVLSISSVFLWTATAVVGIVLSNAL